MQNLLFFAEHLFFAAMAATDGRQELRRRLICCLVVQLGGTRTSILEILRNANSSVSVLRSSQAALPWTGLWSPRRPHADSRLRADARGRDGDRINAVLAAAGYNFILLLRWRNTLSSGMLTTRFL